MAVNYSDIKSFEYPLNLFKMISGNIDYVPECDKDEWIRTVTFLMNYRLSSREIKIINLRYCDCLSIQKISDIFGLINNRIIQIHNKAIRKLRKSWNMNIINIGVKKYILSKIRNDYYELDLYDNVYIDDLGLSIRSKNCILRSIRNSKETTQSLGDLLRFLADENGVVHFSKMMKFRYFGKISYEEVVYTLDKYACRDGMKLDYIPDSKSDYNSSYYMDYESDFDEIVSEDIEETDNEKDYKYKPYETPKCTIKELFIIRGDKITKRRTIICGNCETEYHSEIFDPVDMTELHCPNCGQLMIDNKFIE